ncbi:WSC domain-containing protein ARB_07867-like [Anneissia japonica]|uniref:WSC domain-containing protein ARB_07867-like n=1 Tax=Anneissia japonica TaxID=1529436 RepID=UPI001425577F|nr:WSC domain-containing protein ARB_07867-like [Anneissia japonica]
MDCKLIFVFVFLGTFSAILADTTPTPFKPKVYKGCFQDKPERAMPSDYTESGSMTIDQCITHCHGRGHMYAGLQYGKECFCGGNTYSKYGRVPDTNCNVKCAGNSQEICGGTWKISVYATEVVYEGCFQDKPKRAMPSDYIKSGSMTIGQCITHCHGHGHMYAGLQYGMECFCGDNTYSKYGRVPDTHCNVKCRGNLQETCGGTWKISVYATEGTPSSGLKLVTKGLKVAQSSFGWGGIPVRAIDGNIAANYNQQSCTHTLRQPDNWWRVDLGKSYKVNKVKIYNRADCCKDRLNGATVRVGDNAKGMLTNAVCGDPIKDAGFSSVIDRECELNGQYVSVSLKNEYLTLCEVEVWGEDL